MATASTILLTVSERNKLLATIPNWNANASETHVSRALKFDSFSEAWGFMTRVALWGEQNDHHPIWKNVYASGEPL